jgi:amino acid permease
MHACKNFNQLKFVKNAVLTNSISVFRLKHLLFRAWTQRIFYCSSLQFIFENHWTHFRLRLQSMFEFIVDICHFFIIIELYIHIRSFKKNNKFNHEKRNVNEKEEMGKEKWWSRQYLETGLHNLLVSKIHALQVLCSFCCSD